MLMFEVVFKIIGKKRKKKKIILGFVGEPKFSLPRVGGSSQTFFPALQD